MQLELTGLPGWLIDAGYANSGKRWAEVWKKNDQGWDQFSVHDNLSDALDTLVSRGLGMSETEVCQQQGSCG